ncbi:hypothetical protein [Teredinibacter purpureus]|uniref:hypothetical protein n=1 Tax=Teredinibacter purpureus TaxID=2731756 RepID=UPI0013C4E201|nr:hypothetical protein [Teredinibacter purpureus]
MVDFVLTSSEMNKWAQRLAAEDWTWITWKWLLGNSALIVIWLVFVLAVVQMLLPKSRQRLSRVTGRNVDGSTIFTGIVFTWLAGTFSHGAIFGSGPYGYWLQNWLGESTFQYVAEWTYTYFTLFGPIKFFL